VLRTILHLLRPIKESNHGINSYDEGLTQEWVPQWTQEQALLAKLWNDICTIRPQNGTHLKQTTAVVGVIVNLKMVTTIVASTTQSISAGSVRP
jgi:hypothetical protein